MEKYDFYEDIGARTNGEVYIGVVGPVRTGKSTFIRRFMEKMVIPHSEKSARKVMIDELPQAGAGKTITTTEPKFVPANAAEIKIHDGATVKVRLVDCVGFAVEGANGYEEDGKPRLVKTPWSEEPLPFEKAGDIGTEKVICDHSTIGILVTTDGSISELRREAYVFAEERAVAELKRQNKPFIILVNGTETESTRALAKELEEKYGCGAVGVNAESMTERDFADVLKKILFEFPVSELDITLPAWMQSLPSDSETVSCVLSKLKKKAICIEKMRDCFDLADVFDDEDGVYFSEKTKMDLGTGKAELCVEAKDGLFYKVLSKESGTEITDDFCLMKYVLSLADAKRNYDKIGQAFKDAEENGYGTVSPDLSELKLDTPKLIKKGAGYGVNFRAVAPTYHIMKVEVSSEVNPIIGTQTEGEEFVKDTVCTYEEDEKKVWDTNIFGKTLKDLVSDNLSKKTEAMPEAVRKKMRRTLTRIVNEGKGGVICILL